MTFYTCDKNLKKRDNEIDSASINYGKDVKGGNGNEGIIIINKHYKNYLQVSVYKPFFTTWHNCENYVKILPRTYVFFHSSVPMFWVERGN
jgi:hypothetical protein